MAHNKGAPRHTCDATAIKMSEGVKPILSWVRFMCWFPRGQSISNGVSGLGFYVQEKDDARPALGRTW